MEADWAAEVGGDVARIEADWAGFVDLGQNAGFTEKIVEAHEHPALRQALLELNRPGSPVFTSKCDVWDLAPEEIDPVGYDCAATDAKAGFASYIDVIIQDRAMFASFDSHEAWLRRVTEVLRGMPGRPGRVDLVVRAASAGGLDGFGVTLYAAGCGVDASSAEAAWAEILRAAVVATMREVRASSSIG